jgi:signal transduction histidine kinase
MKDLGIALTAKNDLIMQKWLNIVRQDLEIKSAKGLAYESVRNSLPLVLEAIASLLTDSLSDREEMVQSKGLEHGLVRAEQGYDAAELIKEYSLLRGVIFSVLKPELVAFSSTEVLDVVHIINQVLDEVVGLSVKKYTEARLKELEKVKSQLLFTNQELNRLISTHKDNLSYLAHELKNPLNSIIGLSTLLLQQPPIAEKSNTSANLQMIERVLKNGQQILTLINTTLEISRYESGQIKLNLESANIRHLIYTIVEALEAIAQMKGLNLTVDCQNAPEQVITDPLRLQQIITNLVSNALRYTDSGTISIVAKIENDQQWSLQISDTGKGISPEDQDRIFQPFFRVSSSENYAAQSTGLGLAIVAKLVNILQGNIELVSQLDQGSTFTVILPIELKNRLS